MYFYRKIKSVGCWTSEISGKPGHFTGDMIADISTKQNTISLWELKNPNDVSEILDLAIVNQLGRDVCSKQTYVLIEEKELTEKGFEISHEKLGICEPLSDSYKDNIKSHHYDLVNVDYEQLGLLASIIRSKVENKEYGDVFKEDLKKAINNLIQNDYVDKTKLKDTMLVSLDLKKKEQKSS